MANEMRFLCKGCEHYLVCKHANKERIECSMYKPYTVDAVPVVHGRWIWSEENECYVCSNCELSALNNYRANSTDSNYCPHCGADMRERSEGE